LGFQQTESIKMGVIYLTFNPVTYDSQLNNEYIVRDVFSNSILKTTNMRL